MFAAVLEKLIALLHPFMPFITEEIHAALGKPGMLITGKWPEPGRLRGLAEADATMAALLCRSWRRARSIRGDYAIPPTQALDLRIGMDDFEMANRWAPTAT